jgi:hypothetical protein
MLILVVVDELFHGHVRTLAEETHLLEHLGHYAGRAGAPGRIPDTRNPVYEVKKRPSSLAVRNSFDQRSASSRLITPASASRSAVEMK